MKGLIAVFLVAAAVAVGLWVLGENNLGPCESMGNAHQDWKGHTWRGHRVDCVDGILVKIDGHSGLDTGR